ncbi:MAG: HAMP domain-containing histidine kinase [Lachnospiraceae bacterium]|nr:HAMP domain-containing histidine kinase [Lachnospiraceae bacterium]
MKRNVLWILTGLGILVLILTDTLLIGIQNRSYEEKIQILSVMIEEQGKENVDTAIELLKGLSQERGEAGQDILKSYGYLGGQMDWYQQELRQSVEMILLLSGLAFLLYLLAAAGACRLLNREKQKELRELGRVLRCFRKRTYSLKTEGVCRGREKEMEEIYEQLNLLWEMMKLSEERLQKEKEGTKSLVTDISHQLKTPVAGLKTCFEILEREDLEPKEREEFQEQCRRQLKGLEVLVGALVNISRMETGMIQIKKEPAYIQETLLSAVNRVYLKAEEKEISIEFETEEEIEHVVISHDVKWFCEALINILENAIKYSERRTVIVIRVARLVSFLRIEIQDQGIGIPKKEYHKIFRRFYRGESPEAAGVEGSGVGLYLTREIIEYHQGSVTVSSRCQGQDRGSTFVIQIPYQ